MHLLRCTCLAALLLLFPSCGNERQAPAALVQKIGVNKLRQDAALLYKDLFASHGRDFVGLSLKDCPASFQRISPKRVGAYQDGICLALDTASGAERGLYIVPATMDHVPENTPAAKFERVANGIYWYAFQQ